MEGRQAATGFVADVGNTAVFGHANILSVAPFSVLLDNQRWLNHFVERILEEAPELAGRGRSVARGRLETLFARQLRRTFFRQGWETVFQHLSCLVMRIFKYRLDALLLVLF